MADEHPCDATTQPGFANELCSLGRCNALVKKFAFGHNNYGASNWIDFYSSNVGESNFLIDDLVFPNVQTYETVLGDVLDQIAGEMQELKLCLSGHIKYLSRDGLDRIMNILVTKCTSLTEIYLTFDPQDNAYLRSQPMAWPAGKPEYAFIIRSLAKLVDNNADHLKSVKIKLGRLSSVDDEEMSKDLARAIRACNFLKKLDMDYAPWVKEKNITLEIDDEYNY